MFRKVLQPKFGHLLLLFFPLSKFELSTGERMFLLFFFFVYLTIQNQKEYQCFELF